MNLIRPIFTWTLSHPLLLIFFILSPKIEKIISHFLIKHKWRPGISHFVGFFLSLTVMICAGILDIKLRLFRILTD